MSEPDPKLEEVLQKKLRRTEAAAYRATPVDSPVPPAGLEQTALHIMAVRGDADSARVLIDAGAVIDARGLHGYTPLMEAISQGHRDVAHLLLLRGADPFLVNDDGDDALTLAKALHSAEILALFKD